MAALYIGTSNNTKQQSDFQVGNISSTCPTDPYMFHVRLPCTQKPKSQTCFCCSQTEEKVIWKLGEGHIFPEAIQLEGVCCSVITAYLISSPPSASSEFTGCFTYWNTKTAKPSFLFSRESFTHKRRSKSRPRVNIGTVKLNQTQVEMWLWCQVIKRVQWEQRRHVRHWV